MRKSLAGTGALARLIIRRDRVLLAIWVVVVGLLPVGIAASFAELYPTAEAREAFAETNAANPVILAFLGPILDTSLGGLVAWRVGVMSMLFAGIPSLLFIIRHTRAEEESGRRELLGSTVVGRHAPLTATLGAVFAANLVLATIVAGGLIAYGLPASGSVALGLSMTASGFIMAAVAAVAAQLTQSSAAARSISLVVFGAVFMMRVAGDSGGENSPLSWVSWASPLGWARLTRPFADERWWVFMLVAVFTVALVAVAYALSAQRDLDAGFLPARLGPAEASPALRSPLALAWRLQRGAMFGWSVGFALIGGLLGAVASTGSNLLDTPQLEGWLSRIEAGSPGEALLMWTVYIIAQIVSAYAVIAVLRLRSEETKTLADTVLTTPTSRLRWAASHLVFAFLGPVAMLAALGLCAGLAYGLTSGNVGGELADVFGGAMSKLPAVWVVSALAVAVFGLVPRFAAFAAWGALAVFILLELGWEVRQVSDAVFGISPFAHVHPYVAEVSYATVAGLLAVATILTATGLVGLKNRDIG